jgi:type IV secretory pathway VirB10-like protein
MITKPVVAGLLAAGCLSAAAAGAYVAGRQNTSELKSAPAPVSASPAPVAETEALVTPAAPVAPEPETAAPGREPELEKPTAAPLRSSRPVAAQTTRRPERADRPAYKVTPTPANSPTQVSVEAASVRDNPVPPAAAPETGVPVNPPRSEPVRADLPALPEVLAPAPEREFVEVVVPASSVIGLQVETSLSTERARVEDRVDARVTRDVSAEGRVAIPSGSRVIGSVILVERGGKIKERARLGVRFHTLVFADGTELPIRTEAIYREGESPSGDSARKIGGAAVGGAILGAILGGGKGAVLGGAAGAAGGTAASMAGDRNAASLPAGTIVTVRLSEPVTLDVEKRER